MRPEANGQMPAITRKIVPADPTLAREPDAPVRITRSLAASDIDAPDTSFLSLGKRDLERVDRDACPGRRGSIRTGIVCRRSARGASVIAAEVLDVVRRSTVAFHSAKVLYTLMNHESAPLHLAERVRDLHETAQRDRAREVARRAQRGTGTRWRFGHTRWCRSSGASGAS